MLLSVNTVVHLAVKVELSAVEINGLAEWAHGKREELVERLLSEVLRTAQEAYLERVRAGVEEVVCTACGVVSRGEGGWVRRGERRRRMLTSSGPVVLPLLQITCRDCSSTRAPLQEALGIGRERMTRGLERRLVERVMETSYAKSVQAAWDCMGVRVAKSTLHRIVQAHGGALRLTRAPGATTLLADGTRVPAGRRADQEDLRIAVQLLGRSEEQGRSVAQLRLVGLEAGLGTWPAVLGRDEATTLVVTDAEPALRAYIAKHYPQARHQMCEWHVAYTLDWSLLEDRVPRQQRKELRAELGRILWGPGEPAARRALYNAFVERLQDCPASRKQLRQAAGHILHDEPSAERTTSVLERQMRECNRRVDCGARWSVRGVRNLVALKLARKHNPDDYARLWSMN